MIMDAHNTCIADIDEPVRQRIIQKHSNYRSLEELELKPQICVYYDAWENR